MSPANVGSWPNRKFGMLLSDLATPEKFELVVHDDVEHE